MSIDFTLSVGYRRRHPAGASDRWAARIDSIALLIIGGSLEIALILLIAPHILDWLRHLGGS